MNILIVVESIDVDNSSGSKANVALINNLEQAGFKLKVYHYSRKKLQLNNIECVNIPENRKSILFFLSRGERYIRFFFNLHLNKYFEMLFGFSFTLLNDRNSIINSIKKEKNFNPNWILTLSQGGSFRPHHALLKIPKSHSKWIAYIHDPYPMHWYPKPYTWKESGYKKKETFMKKIAEKCNVTAFPSQLLMEWMGQHHKYYLQKGIVIPHQLVEVTDFEGLNNHRRIGSDTFTLLHAGNLLQARKPHALVEGFLKFKKDNPRVSAQLLFVGPTEHYKTYLEEQSKDSSSIQVEFDSRPFKEVLLLQKAVDVNVILEAKADFSPFLPGKFPHCIQAEKPILILGPIKSEVRRLLGTTYPYWSPQDDSQRIASTIQELYNNWIEGDKYLIREDLKKYLSAEHLRKAIESIPRKA